MLLNGPLAMLTIRLYPSFLNQLQADYKFLESSYLTAGTMMLDRFSQYSCGVAISVLNDPERYHVVLKDVPPLIVPVIGAMVLNGLDNTASQQHDLPLKDGDLINLLDPGGDPLRVRFRGVEQIEGKPFIKIEQHSGTQLIAEDLRQSIEKSARQDYKKLANSDQVGEWKNAAVDPLHFLVGKKIGVRQRVVLVFGVTARWLSIIYHIAKVSQLRKRLAPNGYRFPTPLMIIIVGKI